MIQITNMAQEHVNEAVDIHVAALSEDFLPTLGPRFLRTLYHSILALNIGLGFVAVHNDQVCGFVLATVDSESMFKKVLRSSGHRLACAAIGAVIRQPLLLLRLVETFLYPSKDRRAHTDAELIVIAASQDYRGQGIGTRLVESLDHAFRQLDICNYKVTVHQDKEAANRFYRSLGFQFQYTFTLYQKPWNLYTKHIC